jgi:hypothetical protein
MIGAAESARIAAAIRVVCTIRGKQCPGVSAKGRNTRALFLEKSWHRDRDTRILGKKFNYNIKIS